MQELVQFRHKSFFNCFHMQFPLLDQKRYLLTWRSKLDKEGGRALVFAIWMHGASFSAAPLDLKGQLYMKCRKYLEQVETGTGANLMTVEVAQASLLLALYEFKHMHFARAWLSHARALRLVRMLRLHRLDSDPWSFQHIKQGTKSKVSERVTFDGADSLECRQIFWVAFMLDRLSNAGSDWPVTFEESEVGILAS
jgi:Fungal specific transcription factor domain